MSGLVGIYTRSNLIDFQSDTPEKGMIEEITYTANDQFDQWHDNKLFIARVHHGIVNTEPQPIFNGRKTLCAFMDGEVFGYEDEKRQLIAQGHRFEFKNNDAEFCIQLYEKEGPAAVRKLNGSFIIAFYHLDTGELLLVNDRLSSRPLFYYWDGKRLAFGSQIRPLLKLTSLPRQLDHQAIYEFFSFKHPLGNHTFYSAIKVLPPASIISFRDNQFHIEQYWRMEYKNENHSENYYVEAFAEALEKAVERRTRGSARIGLLLSGGIDSRAVLACDKKFNISTTLTVGDYENLEVQIARKIAEIYKRRFVFLKRDYGHYHFMLKESVDISDGMYQFDHAHHIGMFDRIRAECDIVLHAFGFDRLFKGIRMPLMTKRLLGKNILVPKVDIKSDATYTELVSKSMQMIGSTYEPRLFRVQPAEIFQLLSSSVESLLKASDNGNSQMHPDQIMYCFLNYAADKYTSYFHVYHNRPYIDERTVAFDNDLIDVGLKIPSNFQVKGRLFKKVLLRLSPCAAWLTNANTGLPAATPVWPECLLLAAPAKIKKFYIKSGPLPPHPAYTTGSWQNMGELIRYDQGLAKLIQDTIHNGDYIDPDIFNIDNLNSIYEQHMRRQSNYEDILLLLLTFGFWYKKYGPPTISRS